MMQVLINGTEGCIVSIDVWDEYSQEYVFHADRYKQQLQCKQVRIAWSLHICEWSLREIISLSFKMWKPYLTTKFLRISYYAGFGKHPLLKLYILSGDLIAILLPLDKCTFLFNIFWHSKKYRSIAFSFVSVKLINQVFPAKQVPLF